MLWHYILTRADLPAKVQVVNIAHAADESITPELAPLRKDTRLCWLHAKDEVDLALYADELARKSVPHAVVRGTDGPHAGQAMALACAPSLQRSKLRKIFHHLPLAKLAAP